MLVASSTPKLVAATGLAVFVALVVHFLARAISIRRRFYKMKAIGIVRVTFILGVVFQDRLIAALYAYLNYGGG